MTNVIVEQGVTRVVRSPGAVPAIVRQVVDAPRVVRTGVPGPPGEVPRQSLIAGAAAVQGGPLYVSRATGQALPARADGYQTAMVSGLAATNVESGFPVAVARGLLTLSDWTAVTGAAGLQVGQWYFLTGAGGLSPVPPTRPEAVALSRVGQAVSADTLDVQPSPPIQL